LFFIVLFIVDSGCSKLMTGNLKLLINFIEKFLGTVKFRNDQIAPILGYGDLVQGAITIKRVYYVEGLHHNLFSVGSHGTDLYSITLQDTTSPNLICLMAKVTSSQAWLWHLRLSHLNFDTINLLSKNDIVTTPSSKRQLQLLHMDLCGPMRVASINGKKYVLVIADDYSRYTWTHCLRSKDETPKVLINFLRLVQRGLHAQIEVDHVSSDPGPQYRTVTTSNELDLLFSPMFDELLNGSSHVVSKYSVVATVDVPNQQTIEEYAHVQDDEFINIFSTLVQDLGETSNRHVDSSNMHTFYQHHPSEHRWTKDNPLEQVIGTPSQTVRTRCQLKLDGEMCIFTLTVSQTKPKNIKEAMADSTWIESMQEELHQFDRLDVWELVDRPLCKNIINMNWL
nr:hypothetical protein [Tanacetum cinerariifolium]